MFASCGAELCFIVSVSSARIDLCLLLFYAFGFYIWGLVISSLKKKINDFKLKYTIYPVSHLLSQNKP